MLADAAALEDIDVVRILTYFDKGPVTVGFNVVHEALLRIVPERMEGIMGWMTQPFYEKGLAEGETIGAAKGELRGEARGEAKGKVTGSAQALAFLLEKRFGVIPDALHKRLFAADIASIETWLGRVLDAPDLQAVFSQH